MSNHMNYQYYRCFAAIDLTAIGENLKALQAKMAPGVKTCAVVKANAYGHGAVRVAKHIGDMVDYFAVACIEEALELREGGIKKPILVLSYTHPSRYVDLVREDVTATVYNEQEAEILSETAQHLGKTVKVHIAVDTGMGRIGFQPVEESARSISRIVKLPNLKAEGIFSHYACADCADKTSRDRQNQIFDEFLALLAQRGVKFLITHICNSAGTMEADKRYDMCRVGVAMYGLYPSEEMDHTAIRLKPAMEVISHVVHVKTVPAGTPIGYGHIYVTPREMRIATLSIGYADGYDRCLTGVGYVLIKGKKAPIVGKVCMDQVMVDVTDIDEELFVGNHAVMLGKSRDQEISAETLGALCHSFNYEVVCTFMPRVARVYYINGKMEA